ncbi:transcriptional regulator [Isoptericola sp. NPDC057391]|uniref:transcriptional regulator n=1 Tax=Isoptericola sp. NPDC057391 TaxID=3346117 RepID=UPI00363961DA
MSPAESRLDEAIHALGRLRLCALLRPVDSADFAALRDTLGMSDASLSKTIRALAEVGYVRTTKQASSRRADARRTTSVALTSAGRRALEGHLAALRTLADPSEGPNGSAAASEPARP